MKIAVATKANWSQVSGHAGQTTDWLVYHCQPHAPLPEPQRIELTKAQLPHYFQDDDPQALLTDNMPQSPRSQLMAKLLARPASPEAVADPLRPVLASILAGRCMQQGVLSATLGLSSLAFEALCADYFPGEPIQVPDAPAHELFELDDLNQLLLGLRGHQHASEVWLANIVAHACGGPNHLWQDLGLAHRGELSSLMTLAFPALAALNVGDMKWKKFIYRQYCSMEGIHVCPAPSCGECTERSQCFAPED